MHQRELDLLFTVGVLIGLLLTLYLKLASSREVQSLATMVIGHHYGRRTRNESSTDSP